MIEKKKILQLLIAIFTMGWIIPICIGIGFLCAHYDLNIVNKGINSFPHLDFGMTMLKYGGMWLGYSGLLARPCGFYAGYCPHVIIDGDNTMYGMRVELVNDSAIQLLNPGETAIVVMNGIYENSLKYQISMDMKFSLMEGPKKIGFGVVLAISP